MVVGPGGGDSDDGGGGDCSRKIFVSNQFSCVSVVYEMKQDENSVQESKAVIFLA